MEGWRDGVLEVIDSLFAHFYQPKSVSVQLITACYCFLFRFNAQTSTVNGFARLCLTYKWLDDLWFNYLKIKKD